MTNGRQNQEIYQKTTEMLFIHYILYTKTCQYSSVSHAKQAMWKLS